MPPKRVYVYRYLAGRPLDGRSGHPYLQRGPARWPGWKRQVARVMVPAATLGALVEPHAAADVAVLAVAVGARQLRRKWQRRRFQREYISPTLAAISHPLGGVPVKLHVDPGLGNLTPRLAKPLSPAEKRAREVYGEHVEPVVRWPVEQWMRALWAAQKATRPATRHLEVFRRPGEKPPPRIEVTASTPYLTVEQRNLVSAVVKAKIPVSDLIETWNQVGAQVTATWVVRRRPPAKVGIEDLVTALPGLAEWEYYIGAGPGAQPVTLSLHDDSPHIAVSAGSGAGKSVFAQLVAVQVLARGGRVVILDRKGSHRWALGVPGVDYCTRPEHMHNALLRLAKLADDRNDAAMHEEEGWDPGARTLVICEELNATIGQLVNWWAETRDKSDPKRSPAVSALANLLFMGRSAKVNVLAIAQMLTARAIGGPEARENFGIRCLARYTSNAWKMLVPEAAMPRTSRTLGRWQVVIGGQATEVQVCYLSTAQARRIATPVPVDAEVPDRPLSSDFEQGQGQGEILTLRQAVAAGVLPWPYETAKKRLQRTTHDRPVPRGKSGWADLYRRADLEAWASQEAVK